MTPSFLAFSLGPSHRLRASVVHKELSTFLASRRASLSTSLSLRAAASARVAVRFWERDTTESPRRLRARALANDWAPPARSEVSLDVVLDEASRLSEVAGSAASTPMVTADIVATTAIGADTRTERGS